MPNFPQIVGKLRVPPPQIKICDVYTDILPVLQRLGGVYHFCGSRPHRQRCNKYTRCGLFIVQMSWRLCQ